MWGKLLYRQCAAEQEHVHPHGEAPPLLPLLQVHGGLHETVTEVSCEKGREKTVQRSPAGKVFPPGESRKG